jgi:hypothetical protein
MKRNGFKALAAIATTTMMFSLSGMIKPASAASLWLTGLTDNNTLISFSPDDPSQIRSVGVTGLDGTLIGIDIRSADGLLYGITDTNKIYTINPLTGEASFQSMLNLSFTGGMMSGVDFNPAADRLRLVGSNDQNFRLNVDNGMVADFDPNTDGLQPDGMLAYIDTDANFGIDPNITSAAYTNAFPGPGSPAGVTPPTRTTQLFGIDSELDTLVLQNPPNNGGLQTIGSLGFDFESMGGFDIFSPEAGNNTAFAASGSMLYTIDLSNGSGTMLGTIGNGNVRIIGLAATTVPEPGMTSSLLVTVGLVGLLGYRKKISTR